MPRSKKPRPSVFDPEYRPYGIYSGGQSAADWRAAFGEAMSLPEAESILGDDSPWAILGLKPGASDTEIQAGFRKMSLKYHPDMKPDGDAEKFKTIKAAYVKLGEPR